MVGEETRIIWDAFGQRWRAVVRKDGLLGDDTIPVINIALDTANEELSHLEPNCYYRGSLVDDSFTPINGTHAYIGLCDSAIPFDGFIADHNYVFNIIKKETSTTGIVMEIDNQNQAVPYKGISEYQGEANTTISEGLYPRRGGSLPFPSVEIAVEPAYVKEVGEDVYFYRIIKNLAFANFVYEQSGMKPFSLVAVSLLDKNVIWSGG